MRQIVYTMHFRGQASASGEGGKVLRVTSSGTSSVMETTVGPEGAETSLRAAPGDLAFLECELRSTGTESFEGSGTLAFGDEGEHQLRLATAHPGHLGPSAVAHLMAGSVTWHVQGGSGRFEGATGLVTSVFTLDATGELSDYHCGLLFVAG